jgi:penicillin amidase
MEYVKILESMVRSIRLKLNAKEIPQEYAAISKSVAAILDQSPVSPFIGSNSWVIAPEKKKTEKSFLQMIHTSVFRNQELGMKRIL